MSESDRLRTWRLLDSIGFQIAVDAIFEPELALLAKLHQRDRRHRLGDRSDSERGLRGRGDRQRGVGHAEASCKRKLPILDDSSGKTGQRALVEGVGQNAIEPLGLHNNSLGSRVRKSYADGILHLIPSSSQLLAQLNLVTRFGINTDYLSNDHEQNEIGEPKQSDRPSMASSRPRLILDGTKLGHSKSENRQHKNVGLTKIS